MGLFTLFFWFSLYAYSPQLSSYAKDSGASYTMVGIIGGAYGLSQTLLRIPFGIAADKKSSQKLFLFFGAGFALISGLLFLAKSSVAFIFTARLFAGMAAASWANASVLYASYYDSLEAPKALGHLSSYNRTGMFLGMLVGSIAGNFFGMSSIFIASILGALAALVCLPFVEEQSLKEGNNNDFSNQPIISKSFIFYTGLVTLAQLITYGTTFTFTPLVARSLGASMWQLGVLNMSFIVPQMLVGPFIGGSLLEKFGEKKLLFTGYMIFFCSSLLIPWASNLTQLYGLQVLAGLSNSLTFTLLGGLVIKKVPWQQRSRVTGYFQSSYGVGMLLGPTLMGALSENFGILSGFIFSAGLSLICLIVILIFSRESTS